MRFTTAELAAALGATVHGDEVVVDGVGIDSRSLPAGALFVPVVADRDGHDFIEAAVQRGARAHLSSRSVRIEGATALEVDDTVDALRVIGHLARTRIGGPVVGITGSVGKTSAKDLARSVLATTLRTAASERSFNNELGVPLTLAAAPDDVEVVVVEMGARGSGHIAELCDVAEPTIGVVTVVAMAHTERFGSLEGVLDAKAELVEHLSATGTAVLNVDDPAVASMAQRTDAAVLRYGTHGDVIAEHVALDDDLRATFTLRSGWGSAPVHLGVRGVHQVTNALAAACVGLLCGVPLDAVVSGLGASAASPWRMDLQQTPSGVLILNDAYNANPTSTAAALEALHALAARRRFAVLGPMAELGDHERDAHAAIAQQARALGIEVVAVGTSSYGGPAVADHDAALEVLGELGDGDAVLVKGSRVAGLERLAARLLRDGTAT